MHSSKISSMCSPAVPTQLVYLSLFIMVESKISHSLEIGPFAFTPTLRQATDLTHFAFLGFDRFYSKLFRILVSIFENCGLYLVCNTDFFCTDSSCQHCVWSIIMNEIVIWSCACWACVWLCVILGSIMEWVPVKRRLLRTWSTPHLLCV